MTNYTTDQTLKAILRSDLPSFVHKVFATVSPADVYFHNWHIDAITYELARCLNGENSRLLITQPPRSLKSICTSVAFVAWALGRNPKLRFVCASYSQELASELARQFRLVVESEWYRDLFPKTRTSKNTESQWVTTAGGSRISTSVGGTFTGRGADILIIDDPLKAEDAASQSARKAVQDWYSSTVATRLNDKRRGSIIVVMQRLHEEDLVGHLLDHGDWHHLDLPAFAIADERIRVGPDPEDVYERQEGEVLHPAREPRKTLERIKGELGSLAFSAQYQQTPVPLEGNLVKREWFNFYDQVPEPRVKREIVQSWDVAATATDRSDWSVCTTWFMQQKTFYLVDVWRGRMEFPKLKRQVIALQQRYNAQTVLIEKTGLALGLYQDLINDPTRGFPKQIGISPKMDKLARLEAQSARIEAGHVVLPRDAPWLGEFLNEILAFPSGRHDDQVDSVSQFLEWTRLNRHSPHPQHCTCEMDEGEEVQGLSVVSGGDTAEVLELVDAALDAVAGFVDGLVVVDQPLAPGVARDHRGGAGLGDAGADVVAVIGGIGEDVFGLEALHERRCLRGIASLSRCENDPERSAVGIGGEVQLGGQSASGTPQSLIAAPPFPVAAC